MSLLVGAVSVHLCEPVQSLAQGPIVALEKILCGPEHIYRLCAGPFCTWVTFSCIAV